MKRSLITLIIAAATLSAQAIVAYDFDPPTYSLGQIHGQDGWNAPSTALDKATIVADPTGGTTSFSNQVLALNGSPTAKMNHFVDNSYLGTPVSFSMDVWMAEGTSADPAELFIQFNSWSNFIALKPFAGIIELRSDSGTNTSIAATTPYNTVFNFELVYSGITGGVATMAEAFIDGVSVGSVALTGVNLAIGPLVALRSQNTLSYVDNFVLVPEPSTYAAILGLLAIGFVAWRRRR